MCTTPSITPTRRDKKKVHTDKICAFTGKCSLLHNIATYYMWKNQVSMGRDILTTHISHILGAVPYKYTNEKDMKNIFIQLNT